MRLRHRPDAFQWRGDMFAYHRIADGDSLACLDRYSPHAQVWPLHSGRKIEPTGPEIRDIIRQVHWLELPERDHDETRFDELMERIAALEAKLAEAPEASPTVEPEPTTPAEPDTRDEELAAALEAAANAEAEAERLRAELALRSEEPKLPDMGEKLSDYGSTWEEDVTGDTLLEAFEEDETEVVDVVRRLSATRQKHLSEQLNVEKARLRRERMLTDEPIPREASIDRLLGLLTRRGEV